MQDSKSSKQQMIRGSVLVLRLLASFASAAHAGPSNRLTADGWGCEQGSGSGVVETHEVIATPPTIATPVLCAARTGGAWTGGDAVGYAGSMTTFVLIGVRE